MSRPHLHLPPFESLRDQFKRRQRMRRNRRLEGTYGRHLINPLIAVQDFEYKDVEYSG